MVRPHHPDGKPEQGVHAVQMELAQSAYMMEDDSNAYCPKKAVLLQVVLKQLMIQLLGWGI